MLGAEDEQPTTDSRAILHRRLKHVSAAKRKKTVVGGEALPPRYEHPRLTVAGGDDGWVRGRAPATHDPADAGGGSAGSRAHAGSDASNISEGSMGVHPAAWSCGTVMGTTLVPTLPQASELARVIK